MRAVSKIRARYVEVEFVGVEDVELSFLTEDDRVVQVSVPRSSLSLLLRRLGELSDSKLWD